MNNIKFRVWCKHFNEWEKDEILIDKYGNILHWGKSGLRMVSPETHIVQRGTGMNDINGKEIFEGDIIRVESGLIKVIYSEDIAGFECVGLPHLIGSRSLYGYKHAQKPDKIFKVVGNIFENPDLIK